MLNELVKKNSGRERPDDTLMFAGESPHQDFLDFSGECPTNCSFVSGHAALGFWFIGLGWVFARRRYLLLGIGVGLVVGFVLRVRVVVHVMLVMHCLKQNRRTIIRHKCISSIASDTTKVIVC